MSHHDSSKCNNYRNEMTAQKVVHLQSNLNPSHDDMQTEAENDDYCVFPHKHIDL